MKLEVIAWMLMLTYSSDDSRVPNLSSMYGA